jgi:glutamate N-acetyltransferase/amino-acid N-acetyltransferase
MAKSLSKLLNLFPDDILLASTGIIGQPINMAALEKALPELVDSLSPEGEEGFSRSILTTDTTPKTAYARISLAPGFKATIWGCAKGSGMIAPNLATFLGFILTDAPASVELMQNLLREGAEATFNRVTIDGDTSTNDSLFLLSSGAAVTSPFSSGVKAKAFERGLMKVLESLARSLVLDGEGATRLVEIAVKGALDDRQAKLAAMTVAQSPLVKTAFFGCDPNWGRVLAALGRSGATFDPYRVDLNLNKIPWVRNGMDNGREKEVNEAMSLREYRLTINLNVGKAVYTTLTCDFSPQYVTINSSYRS